MYARHCVRHWHSAANGGQSGDLEPTGPQRNIKVLWLHDGSWEREPGPTVGEILLALETDRETGMKVWRSKEASQQR